jgi:hypothetical protein
VVWRYTHFYPNLGSTSSHRGESYHPIIHQITNGQLSSKPSVGNLASKMRSILKDIAIDEEPLIRKYLRAAQLHGDAFRLLRG